MRREIAPELYNYNRFPGPQFVSFDNQVKADELTFQILENHKNAFDATVFSQRFSEILLKYDYIVGDWGNEQLRLKGFYKDQREGKRSDRISRLEDYIKEYCNFGCAYFVLENPAPQELIFEEERLPRKRKNQKSRQQAYNKQSKAKLEAWDKKSKARKPKDKSRSRKKWEDRSDRLVVAFDARTRKSSVVKDKAKPTKKQRTNQSQQSFIIRKKDK